MWQLFSLDLCLWASLPHEIPNMVDINELTSMGFTPAESLRALEAAGNDVNKAIEYLVGDLVTITNQEDIPNFESLTGSSQTINGSASDLESQPIDYETQVQSDYSSEISIVETRIPEKKKRDPNEPVVVICTSDKGYECMATPMILVLLQIDGVRNLLKEKSDDEFLGKLAALADGLEGNDDYVLNELVIPEDQSDTPDVIINKIYDTINEHLKNAYNSDIVDSLVKSTVVSTDDGGTSHQLLVIELDADERCSKLHDMLNDLVWYRDLENFGTVYFEVVAPIFTLWVSDEDSYSSGSLSTNLSETFYPEVYGEKYLPLLKEAHRKFEELEREKVHVSNKLMKSLIFQGKKIAPFLTQALNSLEETPAKELKDHLEQLDNNKKELGDKLNSVLNEARLSNVRNAYKNIEGLTPYKLVCVMLTKLEYFYYNKKFHSWVYIHIAEDFSYTQELVNFEFVKHVLGMRTGPFCYLYCDEHKFFESVELSVPSEPTTGEMSEDAPSAEQSPAKSTNLIDL